MRRERRLLALASIAWSLLATYGSPLAASDTETIEVSTSPCSRDMESPKIVAHNGRRDERASKAYPEIEAAPDGTIRVPPGRYDVHASTGHCFANGVVAVIPGKHRRITLKLGTSVTLDHVMSLAVIGDAAIANVRAATPDGSYEAVNDGGVFYFDTLGTRTYRLDVTTADGSTAAFYIDLRDANPGDLATVHLGAAAIAQSLRRPAPQPKANLIDVAGDDAWYEELTASGLADTTRPQGLTKILKLGERRTAAVHFYTQVVDLRDERGRSLAVTLPDDVRPYRGGVDSAGRLLFAKRDPREDRSLYVLDAYDRLRSLAAPKLLGITPNVGILADAFVESRSASYAPGAIDDTPLLGTHGFAAVRDGAGGFWAFDCDARIVAHRNASGITTDWPAEGFARGTELAATKDTLWLHDERALSIVRFTNGSYETLPLPSKSASLRSGSMRVAADGTLWFIERLPSRAAYVRDGRIVEQPPFEDGSLPVDVLR